MPAIGCGCSFPPKNTLQSPARLGCQGQRQTHTHKFTPNSQPACAHHWVSTRLGIPGLDEIILFAGKLSVLALAPCFHTCPRNLFYFGMSTGSLILGRDFSRTSLHFHNVVDGRLLTHECFLAFQSWDASVYAV